MTRLMTRILGMTPTEIMQSRQARGLGGSLTVRLGDRLFRFVMAVLLARVMGPDEFGLYMYVLSWIVMLVMPSLLGTPQFIQREIAISTTKNDTAVIHGMTRWSTTLVVIMSMIVMAAGYMSVRLLVEPGNPLREAFFMALPVVFVMALVRLWQGALRGLGHVILGQLPELILRPALFVVLLIVVWQLMPGWGLNAAHAFLLLGLACLASALLAGVMLLRYLKRQTVEKPVFHPFRWMRQSFHFTILNGLGMLNARMGILMVGAMAGTREAGIFTVAVRGSELIIVATFAAHLALAPRMAALYAEGKLLRLQQMIRRGYRAIALLTFPVFVIFMAFGDKLLLVFGREYKDALFALLLLVVSQYVGVIFGPNGVLLNNTRHEKITMAGAVLSIVVTGTLNVLLIPRLASSGAAIATLGGVVTWNLLLTWMSFRKIGIWTPIIGRIPNGLRDEIRKTGNADPVS